MPSSPSPPPQVVASKIAQTKRSEETQVRVPVFVFIEILCTLLTVSPVKNRLCDDRNKRDRLHTSTTPTSIMSKSSHVGLETVGGPVSRR